MTYTALYRQYRPQTFGEIKGQDHISQTLKNALISGRLNHAYLFCGPRGTGKTSAAKILAKAVNCADPQEGEPCNQCNNCIGITNGSSMDVLEIDAASNRGIDEIRELRDRISFSPVEGPYKVYIIDEVHMLTTEAFNALLKTLEEPPKHAIFILATTDPRKIPATILSRCQRFDFRQISLPVIIETLKKIGRAVGAEIEEEAYFLMARQAEGGLRDALGLLDQSLAGGAKNITLEEVAALLGAVEDELLLELHQKLREGELGEALVFLDKLLRDGKELRQIVGDLTLFYRNLLLLSLGGKAEEIVAAPEEIKGKLQGALADLSQKHLLEIIKILNQLDGELRWTSQGRILTELGIIQIGEIWSKPSPAVEPKVKAKPKRSTEVTETPKDFREVKLHKTAEEQSREQVETIPEAKNISAETTEIVGNIKTDGADNLDINLIRANWEGFLELLRKKGNVSYGAFLIAGELASLEDDVLTIQFPETHKFHREQVERPEIKATIEDVLNQFFGSQLKLACFSGELSRDEATKESKSSVAEEALAIFGGDLVDIIDE